MNYMIRLSAGERINYQGQSMAVIAYKGNIFWCILLVCDIKLKLLLKLKWMSKKFSKINVKINDNINIKV